MGEQGDWSHVGFPIFLPEMLQDDDLFTPPDLEGPISPTLDVQDLHKLGQAGHGAPWRSNSARIFGANGRMPKKHKSTNNSTEAMGRNVPGPGSQGQTHGSHFFTLLPSCHLSYLVTALGWEWACVLTARKLCWAAHWESGFHGGGYALSKASTLGVGSGAMSPRSLGAPMLHQVLKK